MGMLNNLWAVGTGKVPVNTLSTARSCRDPKGRCLIPKAEELRQKYLDALANSGPDSMAILKFQAATFVRHVAQELSTRSSFSYEDVKNAAQVWNAVNRAALDKDIADFKDAAEKAQNGIEAAAKNLCDYIRKPDFLQHLQDHHRDWLIHETTARELYGVSYPPGYYVDDGALPDYKEGDPYLRQIDHYLAILTDKLYLSKEGTKLLEEILDEARLGAESTPGIGELWVKTLWDKKSKVPKVTKPIGLFFYNLSQVVRAKMELAITRAKTAVFSDILADPDIDRHLETLHQRFDLDVKKQLREIAEEYREDWKQALEKAKDKASNRKMIQSAVRKYSQTARGKIEALKEKSWDASLGLAMHLLGFTLSFIELVREIEEGDRDPDSLLPLLRSSLKASKEILTLGASLKARVGQLPRTDQILEVGKFTGFLASGISCWIALRDAEKAKAEGQSDRMWGYRVYAGLQLVEALIAVFLPTGPCGWIVAAAGIGVAFLINYLADPPIVDWLRLTPWGTAPKDAKNRIAYEDVIDQYFERLTPLSVKIVPESDRIEVACKALSDETPVSICLQSENPPKKYPARSVTPGIEPAVKTGDWEAMDKKMEIRDITSKIWNDLQHDGETEYRAYAELTPYEGAALSGHSLPTVLAKAQIMNPSLGSTDWFRLARGGDGKFRLKEDGTFALIINTWLARGCLLNVKLEKTGILINDWDVAKGVTVEADETTLSYKIEKPISPYSMDVTAYLFLPDSKEPISTEKRTITIDP